MYVHNNLTFQRAIASSWVDNHITIAIIITRCYGCKRPWIGCRRSKMPPPRPSLISWSIWPFQHTCKVIDIFFFLQSHISYIWLYHQSGNVARALSMTNELLELVPTHERALGNRAYYQKEIQSKASQSKKKRGEDGQDDTAIPEQVRS